LFDLLRGIRVTINILGVGRSGTSALYTLVQSMMKDQLDGEIESLYEPFLRDQSLCGGDINDLAVRGNFKYIDSLSLEGMYYHSTLPMLIKKAKPYKDNPFLHKLYDTKKQKSPLSFLSKKQKTKKHRLIKYIRANGRYHLLNTIDPDAKTIFIIRNPLDVGNSVKKLFSFYGGEFHKDDQRRFIDEVNQIFGTNHKKETFENYLDEQLFYWYYMNRFALESFSTAQKKPLIICYEMYVNDQENSLNRICQFAGLSYDEKYLSSAKKIVGPQTKQKTITASEYQAAEEYLKKYFELLDSHHIPYGFTKEEILKPYSIVKQDITVQGKYYGLHGRAITKQKSNTPVSPIIHTQFAHIINPVIVPKKSDLYRAQPITFETMKTAQEFATLKGIGVEQYAAYYSEDHSLIPNHIKQTPMLDRSILDHGTFSLSKKLPMLQDILQRAYEESDAKYIIYTNVDIALMPHFYLSVKKIMQEGYDVVNIFRRTLGNHYQGVEEIPKMYADLGSDHPGTDCFVIRRELIPKLDLQNVVIGAEFVAFALRVNLHLFAHKIKEFDRLHMTFHIGDDRTWEGADDFSAFNANEVDKMFDALKKRDDIVNPDELKRFYDNFQERQAFWKSRNS
jgi:hypothetical protein